MGALIKNFVFFAFYFAASAQAETMQMELSLKTQRGHIFQEVQTEISVIDQKFVLKSKKMSLWIEGEVEKVDQAGVELVVTNLRFFDLNKKEKAEFFSTTLMSRPQELGTMEWKGLNGSSLELGLTPSAPKL